MLADLVEETANSPGTGATITLLGAVAGRRTFLSAFGDGAPCYYMLASGTTWEEGIGTVGGGTPNTLARTTVLRNSAGTTARLNFVGTVRVFNVLPAERALYANNGNVVAMGGRPIAGLPIASGVDQAPRLDQVGEIIVRQDTYTTAISGYVVALPSQFARFRLEWEDVVTNPVGVALFFRVSVNGGASYLQGSADYPQRNLSANAANLGTGGGAYSYGQISDGAYNVVQGVLDIQSTGARVWQARSHTVVTTSYIHQSFDASGWGGPGSQRITHLLVAGINAGLSQGRFRLKGIY